MEQSGFHKSLLTVRVSMDKTIDIFGFISAPINLTVFTIMLKAKYSAETVQYLFP